MTCLQLSELKGALMHLDSSASFVVKVATMEGWKKGSELWTWNFTVL